MSRLNKIALGVVVGLIGVTASVMAFVIPYGNPGTLNPDTYTFTAIADGPIDAYFYGSSADFGSDIGLIVNDLSQNIYGLQNHASYYGQPLQLSVGNVHQGDVLEFELQVSTVAGNGPPPLSYSLFSTPGDNADGMQHIYSAPWLGDDTIPAGTYVGFEDILPIGDSDRDYNDHQFIFRNIQTNVPDGGITILLLGFGLVGLGFLKQRFS